VVSRDYQLVTHAEAVDAVDAMLTAGGIDHDLYRHITTSQGKKLYAEFRLPGRKFSLGDDDELEPTITIENSIDRSKSFIARYGTFRLICSNGAIIGTKTIDIKLSHYQQNINLDKVLYALEQGIETGEEIFVTRAREMQQFPASTAVEEFIDNELYPTLFRYTVAKSMMEAGVADFDFERTSNIERPTRVNSVAGVLTLYAFWNFLTAAATHHVDSQRARVEIDRRIARDFFG
jgi:hypothetical protein